MGEGLKQMLSSHRAEEEEDELGETSSLSGGEPDVAEDQEYASSPNNSDKSSLLSHLPLRRGLSKYYQGKSESFSSFSDVGCVGDLAKKETPYKRKMMKTCRSYAGGLDEHNYGPSSGGTPHKSITTIPNKATTNSRGNGACASLIARTSSLFSSGHGKPPPVPIQRNI
ncbi:uncharacterized protein M6B38_138190 [Iris pallida]|uniref:Uncharacterized protein n=1 Tax=Iris pallida TaxID=29817 RepID=A0AAX6FEG7_IRIPA|nr:uncharacterized protein M6B38_109105 [Iris pallida]KAJ6814774.1 uncharacterized protein M6B38_138190 [Iris pallida]